MTIVLNHLRPRYFSATAGSEIWQTEAVFTPGIHLLVAASGRGKSSLLKQLAGVDQTCDGAITYDNVPDKPTALFRYSYMEQQLRHVSSFRVQDLLRLGWPGQTVPLTTVQTTLTSLGLAGFQDRFCATLSRGELQRVLFIRALLQSSSWILLDEPWANVDPDTTRQMVAMVGTAANQGRGVIIASLDKTEAALFDGLAKTGLVKIWTLA
jgi:ABC-type Mn2+/Zn2+ transport system ATPase subunit